MPPPNSCICLINQSNENSVNTYMRRESASYVQTHKFEFVQA